MKRKKAIPVETDAPVQIKPENIPDSAAYVFIKATSDAIKEARKDPDFRAKYEKWKREQESKHTEE